MTSDVLAASAYTAEFCPGEAFARDRDHADPLAHYRDLFLLPRRADNRPAIYFCSHSLGLQPRSVRDLVDQELANWAKWGVEGHFRGEGPWYTYAKPLHAPLARLVGARPEEVVLMNGLTVNLHLMLASFYRPQGKRCKVLLDEPVFPSDLYAVKSHLRLRGIDPAEALVTCRPGPGESLIDLEAVEALLDRQGEEIALVLWSGINFLSGQWFDLQRLIAAAHRQGCLVGLDLAHAVGNVPLHLHDWQADFAVWCTYKYLNSGPGAVAGCFVHDRHGNDLSLPRLAGWWGNDPETRFRLQLEPEFVPQAGAAGWQVSNPPILALAPIRASLAIFDQVPPMLLRAKSQCLTGYLEYLLNRRLGSRVELLTPRSPCRRGCQLSFRLAGRSRDVVGLLEKDGVIVDFREPDIVRVAPVPLYNTFQEVWQFVDTLKRMLN